MFANIDLLQCLQGFFKGVTNTAALLGISPLWLLFIMFFCLGGILHRVAMRDRRKAMEDALRTHRRALEHTNHKK